MFHEHLKTIALPCARCSIIFDHRLLLKENICSMGFFFSSKIGCRVCMSISKAGCVQIVSLEANVVVFYSPGFINLFTI